MVCTLLNDYVLTKIGQGRKQLRCSNYMALPDIRPALSMEHCTIDHMKVLSQAKYKKELILVSMTSTLLILGCTYSKYI